MAVRRPSVGWWCIVAAGALLGCRSNDEVAPSSTPLIPAIGNPPSGVDTDAPSEATSPASCAARDPGATFGSDQAAPAIGTTPAAPPGSEVEAALERWIDEVHAFGASVGIRVPGHDDVVVAAGVDDRLPDRPMPTGGRFQVASITKTFVTALVMQLVENGQLRLDTTIDRWFPDIGGAERITVEMLLAHRSGLPDFARDRPDEYRTTMLADLGRSYSPREAIGLSTALPARFEPGAGYSYSNTNFQLLGEIAAEVTGTPIADLVEQRFIARSASRARRSTASRQSNRTSITGGSRSTSRSATSRPGRSTRRFPVISTSSTSPGSPC